MYLPGSRPVPVWLNSGVIPVAAGLEVGMPTVVFHITRPSDPHHDRVRVREFVGWYNTERYHSEIGYLHPHDLHNGTADTMIDARQAVPDAAYQAHPERFISGPPPAARQPAAAWINKSTIRKKS